MNGKTVLKVTFLVSLFWIPSSLWFALTALAQFEDVIVGVSVGDWVKYGDIQVNWESNDPSLDPPKELTELNNTLWFSNTVIGVSYTSITFLETTQFKDGTNLNTTSVVDVGLGLGSGRLMFISAWLSEHDMLYPWDLSEPVVFINETIWRTYYDVTREVNHLNITETRYTEDDPPQTVRTSVNFYWDRETGVLTERVAFGTYFSQTGGLIASWTRSDRLVDTNLWSGKDESPPIANAGADQTTYRDTTVEFDASGSYDNVVIVSYSWNFGDGSYGTGRQVRHIYRQAGTYTVVLAVEDEAGNTATDYVTVTVKEIVSDGYSYAPIGVATVALISITALILWSQKSKTKRRRNFRRRRKA